MPRISFRNFTGGEVTPTLSARYDLKKSGSFLQCCQNFVPNLHGDIERRPGMVFCDVLGGTLAVMVPFIFNTEPENNYVLLFGADGNIRVAREDGLAGSATLQNPYTIAQVYEISYAQVGDVVYLAHKEHPLRKIYRRGEAPYEWLIEDVVINRSLSPPGAPTVEFQRNNEEDTAALTYTLRYKVTAVDNDGVESIGSEAGATLGKYPTDWVVGNCVVLKWTPVSNAKEYNVYRESAGYYGFIGITSDIDESGYVVFSDQNFEPDTAITPKYDWNPFDGGNNPACICFHGQRMWLAGGKLHPATLYASRVGDFESFRKSAPLQDDDPLEFMLASGSIDDIHWMASFNDLVVGTAGAEYRVTSSGTAITPSDCQINTQSFWGSSRLQPQMIGQSILHCQRSGSHVRDLFYSWESDGYAGNDLSVLAPQLVEGHTITQWCFQQSPSPRLWAVRNDGVLLCLSYMREQNIFAWSRHETGGTVASVACINGARDDVVMLVVKRGDIYYLERLAPIFAETVALEDAQFLDCCRTFEFDAAVTSISGTETRELTYLVGEDTQVTDVEIYEITGGGGDDTGSGGGGGGDDTGSGGGGDDTGSGGGGTDTIFGAIYGTDGNDTLTGTGGADTIIGKDGDDIIDGLGGKDLLYGEAGNDSILGGDGNDYLSGGEGNDTLVGGEGDNTLYGGTGDDSLVSLSGNDTLYGEDGSNTFYVAPRSGGEVVIISTSGNDRLVLGNGITPDMVTMAVSGIDMILTINTGPSSFTIRLPAWKISEKRLVNVICESGGVFPITE